MSRVAISPAILDAIAARAGVPDAEVIEGVRRLSTLFTVGRQQLGQDYLANAAMRRAYLLYFMPVNIAKVASVLAELPSFPLGPLRVLDLGAGSGAASLAFLQHLSSSGADVPIRTEVLAIDRNRDALRDAEAVWAAVAGSGPALRFHAQALDLERAGNRAPWKGNTFDLILVVNVLNELFRDARDPLTRRVKLLAQLLDSLGPNGTLIVIEPALRVTTRALHQVRDWLVAEGKANVYSPCLHERPCPALLHPDDWCHEERSWTAPSWVQDIDRQVGFIKDALKFSYVVLRKDVRTIVERAPDLHRVVSERLVMKGEQRVWLCNETGRQLVGRLDKDRSEQNAEFDQWDRGVIVSLSDIDRQGAVGRVRKTAVAKMIRPAVREDDR
jgi:ribosomal protein RSM22 (predicted rRNA methylase)